MKNGVAFVAFIFMMLAMAAFAQTAGADARIIGTNQGETAAGRVKEQLPTPALERFKKLLLEETDLAGTLVKNLEKQVELGTVHPDGPEVISAKKALLELQERMAAFDAGTVLLPATSSITLATGQNQDIASARNEAQFLEGRQRYRKLLEEEIELIEAQCKDLDRKFQAGAIDRYGPEMISAKRELLGAQQKVALLDAGLLLSPATPLKK